MGGRRRRHGRTGGRVGCRRGPSIALARVGWGMVSRMCVCLVRDALALSPKDDYSSQRRSLPSGVPFAKARERWAEAESEASKRAFSRVQCVGRVGSSVTRFAALPQTRRKRCWC